MGGASSPLAFFDGVAKGSEVPLFHKTSHGIRIMFRDYSNSFP